MGNLLVSEMQTNVVYKMDLNAFYHSRLISDSGYSLDGCSPASDYFGSEEFLLNEDRTVIYFLKTLRKPNYLGLMGTRTLPATIVTPTSVNPSIFFKIATRHKSYVTTGWDPEIFVVDKEGQLIPAFAFLPAKENPFVIRNSVYTDRGYFNAAAYWDGFQAEFSTVPGGCHGYGFDEIRNGLRAVLRQARLKFPDARLTLKNVFEIPQAHLFASRPEHVALGCDPSFNAYGTDPFRIENPFDLPYRMAGGHIHMGFVQPNADALSSDSITRIVKMLDLIIGIPTIGMFADIDVPTRRRFYGRAGEYRRPKHGIEYRTLSSAWLGDPAIGHMIMDLARLCTGDLATTINIQDLNLSDEKIRDVIDTTNVKEARAIFEAHPEIWGPMHETKYGTEKSFTLMNRAVMGGVESILPNYRDVEGNWKLKPDQMWSPHSNNSHATWSTFVNKAVL